MYCRFFHRQDRRRFGFLLFLLFSLSVLHAQLNVGLQLYSFRDQIPKDVPGMLAKIKSMGFRYIEGGGTYGYSYKAFKQLLQKNGLQMVSYGAGFEDLQDHLDSVVWKAQFFGAKYVMCAWVPHNGDVFSIADAKKGVDVFNRAGKALKAKGIDFVYHAHGYEFQPYDGGTLFDYMRKAMDPAFANFEMDIFWFKNAGQDPAEFLRKYPRRFKLLHLKDRLHGTEDNLFAKADVETNVTLGTGDVDIAAAWKAAKKAGIKYAFIEDESSRSLEQVPRSLLYMKTLK